jgi:3',5'-cyclic AMP phosphodiesterase CpdA
MFVLAHLSDPHLSPLPVPAVSELIGKRVTGYLNWRLRRGAHHSRQVLDALIDDLVALRPDHVAVTGDIANLALKAEFAAGRAFLARLGEPERVTFVPGNHDVYVRATAGMHLTDWREYLEGDEPLDPPFPFLRRRGPIALVGLSTAVPTPPFFASGRLGRAQIDRLAALLAELRKQPCFRVVLIHHPPAGERPWLKRLEDAAAFRALIARHGAELILTGHDHIASLTEIEGPERPVPVVQVPSTSAVFDDPRGGGAYNLYRIAGTPGAWSCEMESRGFRADGTIGALGRTSLAASTQRRVR